MSLTQELEKSLDLDGVAIAIAADPDTQDRATKVLELARSVDLATHGREDLAVKLLLGAEMGTDPGALIFVIYPADAEERMP